MSKYGRVQTLEPFYSLQSMHLYTGAPLHVTDFEPKNGVLDQEDLFSQDIYTSTFIPGAKNVDALGSCVGNGGMSALSWATTESQYLDFAEAANYESPVHIEIGAIKLYHEITFETGAPQQEWPPVDCGSSGVYLVEYLTKVGLINGAQVTSGAQNIVSLMQSGPLAVGQPFFNSWEQPDVNGFIDGDGSPEAVQAAVDSGLAGGHETCWSSIEKLTLSETGQVIPEETVIRARNSWSKNWGDSGNYRFHLSTFVGLMTHCDFRQFIPISA